MEAGPQLDRLVAIKVMGCTPRTEPTQDYGTHECCGCKGALHSEPSGWSDCWKSYSTDIGHAWEVVEEMLRKPGIIFEMISGTPDGMAVSFTCAGIPSNSVTPTAPLAICLAALKAVEGK